MITGTMALGSDRPRRGSASEIDSHDHRLAQSRCGEVSDVDPDAIAEHLAIAGGEAEPSVPPSIATLSARLMASVRWSAASMDTKRSC